MIVASAAGSNLVVQLALFVVKPFLDSVLPLICSICTILLRISYIYSDYMGVG